MFSRKLSAWLIALLLLICCLPSVANGVQMDIPNDGQVWATIVFTSDNYLANPREREVLSWFDTNPRLKKLKATTKFTHITASDPIYKHVPKNTAGHSFQQVIKDQFPCVILQTYDGTKVYKVSGKNVPKSGPALANTISAALRDAQRKYVACTPRNPGPISQSVRTGYSATLGRLFPRRPDKPVCPGPDCPTPPPTAPESYVGPPVIDDDVADDSVPEGVGGGLIALLVGAGALAAVAVMFSNATRG